MISNTQPSRLQRLTARIVMASRLGLFADLACKAVLVLCAVLAGSVLLGRSLFAWDPMGWWGAGWVLGLGLVTVFVWAGQRANLLALGSSEAALWLDLRAGAGGQVVTAAEVTDESAAAWLQGATQRAAGIEDRPGVAWRSAAWRLGFAVLCLVACTLVPIREASAESQLETLFSERLGDVAQKLNALEEQVQLDEEERTEFEETLERLEQDASQDPDLEATYEAIDRLEDQLQERAEEALADAEKAVRSLAEVEGMAGADQAPTEESSMAMEQALAASLATMSDLNLAELDLAGLDLDALASGSLPEGALSDLTPEQMAELSKALQNGLEGALGELAAAGLLDASAVDFKTLKSAAQLAKLTPEQLAKLHSCPDCGKPAADQKPGGT